MLTEIGFMFPQEIIQDYDDKGMGMAGPRSGRSSRRKGASCLSDGAIPDARAGDSFEELHRSNVHNLQSNFLGASQVCPRHQLCFYCIFSTWGIMSLNAEAQPCMQHPSGMRPGSQSEHQSGSKGSAMEQQYVEAAGVPSDTPESNRGQPGSTGQGLEADFQGQDVAHVRDGFQGGPPVRPDAHGGTSRAAIEKEPLTTPREGLHAAFGSPLHPDSNLLSLDHEEKGNSSTSVKEDQEALRMGRQHAEALHSQTSAPSGAAQQPDASLLPEQQSTSTDQVLSADAGLDNGPSAANNDWQRGASSRGVVENAFAVDHQDGAVAWPSGCDLWLY